MGFQFKALSWITTTLLLCIAVPTPGKPSLNLEISKAVAEETTSTPNRIEEANRLSETGKEQLFAGEYAAAREKFLMLFAIYREAGDQENEATALMNLGYIHSGAIKKQQVVEIYQK